MDRIKQLLAGRGWDLKRTTVFAHTKIDETHVVAFMVTGVAGCRYYIAAAYQGEGKVWSEVAESAEESLAHYMGKVADLSKEK